MGFITYNRVFLLSAVAAGAATLLWYQQAQALIPANNFVKASENPTAFASYLYHQNSLQYIYFTGPNPSNPSKQGDWWNTPGGFFINGSPTMAGMLSVVPLAPGSKQFSISFVSEIKNNAPAPGARQLGLGRTPDNSVVLRDISTTTTPDTAWEVIDDGLDAKGAQLVRFKVPGTNLFLLFADSLVVRAVTEPTAAQFRINKAPASYLLSGGFLPRSL